MTQEEKQLLFKDLCARLPYGVKFPYHMEEDSDHRECDCVAVIDSIDEDCVEFTYEDNGRLRDWSCPLFQVKPYLRPMSSMTILEEYEYHQCKNIDYLEICKMERIEMLETTALCFSHAIDWLNKNGFDYRGLIPMGLALEAKEGMYKTE
jgi:hypothetical protein